MNWLVLALLAYLLLSLAAVLDKILLSHRIPKPSVYAFYVAILSAFTLVLIPFGFEWQGINMTLLSFFSGLLFIYALLFLYIAVKKNEISRVSPLVGSVVPIVSIFLGAIFLNEDISAINYLGIIVLVLGGLLISFDLPLKSTKIFNGFGFAVLSGALLAAAFIIFKQIYDFNGDNFINGFVWTRIGLVFGGLSLLVFPDYRRQIFKTLFHKKKNKEQKIKKEKSFGTIVLFLLNKVFGGTSSILLNYAISLGSVTIIHAMNSVQFVFVLILASLGSIKYHYLFQEKLYFWDWAQKIISIFIIAVGLYFVSL